MTEKLTYLIKIWDESTPEKFGIGEAALFQGLSFEDNDSYENRLRKLTKEFSEGKEIDLKDYPSIQFGVEQAKLDFGGGCKGIYFPSDFVTGESDIRINGLIWMGDIDTMLSRIETKIAIGCKCIKIKIGALGLDTEIEMLRLIRKSFSPSEIEIRLDANGSFNDSNVFKALDKLAKFHIHSIEQPVKPRQYELMARICAESPIPVALDEELIGITEVADKNHLLDIIMPAFIILKPSLCGGISGSKEWIKFAESRGTGWWITSALESNVGLSALAQWAATLSNKMCQGLGTGNLYLNNFSSPLINCGDSLSFIPEKIALNRSEFNSLKWEQ